MVWAETSAVKRHSPASTANTDITDIAIQASYRFCKALRYTKGLHSSLDWFKSKHRTVLIFLQNTQMNKF